MSEIKAYVREINGKEGILGYNKYLCSFKWNIGCCENKERVIGDMNSRDGDKELENVIGKFGI